MLPFGRCTTRFDTAAFDRGDEHTTQRPARGPLNTHKLLKHKVIFAAIAVLGAVAWAIIAFFCGETVNAVWFVVATVCTYVIGYRFYARLIEMKIVRPCDEQATPAAAIAGAGPLVGPVLAAQMGYPPGTIGIIIGALVGGVAAIVGVLVIMTILLAVLALVIVQAVAQSPWGLFSIFMTIPIALFMGIYLRFLRPGRVFEVSLIGVALLVLAVVSGNWVAQTSWAPTGSACLDTRSPPAVGSGGHADGLVAENFSGDPKLGYWTQHFQYVAAK